MGFGILGNILYLVLVQPFKVKKNVQKSINLFARESICNVEHILFFRILHGLLGKHGIFLSLQRYSEM